MERSGAKDPTPNKGVNGLSVIAKTSSPSSTRGAKFECISPQEESKHSRKEGVGCEGIDFSHGITKCMIWYKHFNASLRL